VSLWSTFAKLVDRMDARCDDAGRARDWIDGLMPPIGQIAATASVFDFTGGRDEPTLGPVERLSPDTFFLPFPLCAAEFSVPGTWDAKEGDPRGASLVIVQRPVGHELGLGRGEVEWPVLLVIRNENHRDVTLTTLLLRGVSPLSAATNSDSLFAGAGSAGEPQIHLEHRMLSHGWFSPSTGKCTPGTFWEESVHGPVMSFVEPDSPAGGGPGRNFTEAAVEVALRGLILLETANSPANWVVRVIDEHARVVKRGGKKRREKRSRYIVVPDRSLDRVLRIPNEGGDHIGRAPHRRRAHWRRLDSPRFRLKRGQRVLVRESWVGPRKATHGGEHYEVITHLPSVSEAGQPQETTTL